jgi:uncharacterized protein
MQRFSATSIVAALTLLLCVVAPAVALDFPDLTGRVVDDAGILDSPTRRDLTQKLAGLEAKSTDQLVVVTLHSLQGTSIDDFGYQLGRRWAIGQKGGNNGVLLIVAPNEHKVRIDVGYGLEGTLTDAVTHLIIENSILPRFRAGDFPGGIARGVDDIIDFLTGDKEAWQQRAKDARSAGHDLPWYFAIPLTLIGLPLFGGFFVIMIMLAVMSILSLIVHFGVWIGLIPPAKKRTGLWRIFNYIDNATPSSSSSSSSSSSWSSSGSSWSSSSSDSGFSGGGGSFGGGGSSGSW